MKSSNIGRSAYALVGAPRWVPRVRGRRMAPGRHGGLPLAVDLIDDDAVEMVGHNDEGAKCRPFRMPVGRGTPRWVPFLPDSSRTPGQLQDLPLHYNVLTGSISTTQPCGMVTSDNSRTGSGERMIICQR